MIQDKTGEIIELYQDWLTAWNQRKAANLARLCANDVTIIGFDGSIMSGSDDVEEIISTIFAHHPTAAYVAIIKETRVLSVDTMTLMAIVGMIPSGKTDINPAFNAIQCLTAVRNVNDWKITLLQNTPLALHGQDGLKDKITADLRRVINSEENN